MRTILEETKLSPEEFGLRIGISGMSIRRWLKTSSKKKLEPLYETAIRNTVFKMVVDGDIGRDSRVFEIVMKDYEPLDQRAALGLMGLTETAIATGDFKDHKEGLIRGLNVMGADSDNQEFVAQNGSRLGTFKKIGSEWRERIQYLVEITKSNKLSIIDKFVAFGALVYLLTTFDLIPDTIPVFGLLDDFAVLGYAMSYYAKRSANGDRHVPDTAE